VTSVLNDPGTRLRAFFPALGRTAEIVAPVAEQQADVFTQAAITFAAISSDTTALQETISETAPTLQTGVDLLPRERPFLTDLSTLGRALRPGVTDLRATLPVLNDAIDVGTPVLRNSPPSNRRLRDVLRSLNRLVSDPATRISLQRVGDTFEVAKPLARYVVPAQTVCNYWNYWFTYLTEHITERDSVGYQQRVQLVNLPNGGLNANLPAPIGHVFLPGEVQTSLDRYSGIQANGKAGLVPNPADNGLFDPHNLPIVHGNPYAPLGQPAFNQGGQVDCQSGQTGYVLGDYRVPGQAPSNPAFGISDIPGARGVTDLYLNQNGSREFNDTRIPSHQP
jgi:hypothetical protein